MNVVCEREFIGSNIVRANEPFSYHLVPKLNEGFDIVGSLLLITDNNNVK